MRSAPPSSLLRHSFTRQAFNKQRANTSKRFTSTESTQPKAQDAFGAAQKTAGKLWESAQKFLGPLGEKVGNMLGSYKEPVIYNLAVTRELLKQIYIKEGLHPPSIAAFRESYSAIFAQVFNPGFVGSLIRNGEIGRVGIYGLQAYGIFKMGEIVGRRSLVGYKLD